MSALFVTRLDTSPNADTPRTAEFWFRIVPFTTPSILALVPVSVLIILLFTSPAMPKFCVLVRLVAVRTPLPNTTILPSLVIAPIPSSVPPAMVNWFVLFSVPEPMTSPLMASVPALDCAAPPNEPAVRIIVPPALLANPLVKSPAEFRAPPLVTRPETDPSAVMSVTEVPEVPSVPVIAPARTKSPPASLLTLLISAPLTSSVPLSAMLSAVRVRVAATVMVPAFVTAPSPSRSPPVTFSSELATLDSVPAIVTSPVMLIMPALLWAVPPTIPPDRVAVPVAWLASPPARLPAESSVAAFVTRPLVTPVLATVIVPPALLATGPSKMPFTFNALVLVVLVAPSVLVSAMVITPALVNAPMPVMSPPVTSSVPPALLARSPVTTTAPAPTTLMSPTLVMVLVPDTSVAVPVAPLKLMMPVPRLLISPASVIVPSASTSITPELLTVFPVPCRVAPSRTVMVAPSSFVKDTTVRVLPAVMSNEPALVKAVTPSRLPMVEARIPPGSPPGPSITGFGPSLPIPISPSKSIGGRISVVSPNSNKPLLVKAPGVSLNVPFVMATCDNSSVVSASISRMPPPETPITPPSNDTGAPVVEMIMSTAWPSTSNVPEIVTAS